MNSQPQFFDRSRRVPVLAATLALHVALVLLWQQQRRHADPFVAEPTWINWIDVMLPRRAAPPVAAPSRPVQKETSHAPARRAAPPSLPPAPTPDALEEAPLAEAPPTPGHSADDILRRARKDLAGIDKQLKEEFPEARIRAPRNTPQARLEKGIELANELAPPKWYEQAKITELVMPGGEGKRRYRVITAMGTFCMTYPHNHSFDAISKLQNGARPEYSKCPPDEQPATHQDIAPLRLDGGGKMKPGSP